MSVDYGVWSENDGGFITSAHLSASEAEALIEALVEETPLIERAEARADLSVREACPSHIEEPRAGCEKCEYDEDETA